VSTAPSGAKSASPQPPPGLLQTLADDVRVVVEDFEKRGWGAVTGPLSGIEAFYLSEIDRQRLAAKRPVRRTVLRLWWLLKSLLLKLTPARRVMLAVALWFLLMGGQQFEFGRNKFQVSVRLPIVSSFLLFTVLMLELKDKLTARDELEAGRKVQLALMPDESPTIPGWDVWLHTQPANDVGGDLVDHLPIDGRRHAVALGDVAGKALPAALLSVKLQATLRALAPYFDDLGALGAGMNRVLHRDGLPTRFASLVYMVLEPDSGHIRLLNAGHLPPLIVEKSAITQMERGSMVLGIMPEATFTEQCVDLNVNDTLIAYSDGVTEAMNAGGDFFGDERLFEIARQTCGDPLKSIGTRILDEVARFIGDAPASDDVSLLILRRR
jgi:sigma-B regulation protein RsbU (phosphoserine phosphatase)